VERFDDIGAPFVDGLAALARDQFRERVQVALDELREVVDEFAAFDARHRPPHWVRLARGAHRGVHIAGVGAWSRANHLARIGGVITLETLARRRLVPAPAYQVHRLYLFHR